MQIAINAIPETGREVTLDLGREWFTRWREEDTGLEFAGGAITGMVRLEKHGHDILVRGHLEGVLEMSCSRCLEPYAAPVAADFDLLLIPGPWEVGADEEELTAQDLDQDFYTGENVDLENILREQIILSMPIKPLCAEICKGLCARCGANLNRETCGCKPGESAGQFGKLMKLKGK